MKKTFRTILAGALALFAVSCYDDSALREDIKELDERVSAIEKTLNAEVGGINDLAARLTAAEGNVADLTDDLASLTSTVTELGTTVTGILTRLDAVDGDIDGIIADVDAAVKDLQAADSTLKAEDLKLAAEVAKIAVVKVEEVAGNVVLTLADGKTVQISKPLSNVDNNGLVTVVETEEGKFWAVLENGQPKSLDIPVGHPDYTFEFSVSADGELQYAVNGGEPVGTGVTTADLSGQKYIISDVVENEDNVVITVGDATYTFPKYVADKGVLNLSRTSFFLRYGASKTIDITSENLSDVYVMSKPDGWKAVVADNKLTVTSPSKKAVAGDAAEAEGLVLLHANDAEGKCVIAKLEVSTGKGLAIEADNKGNLVISNSYTSVTVDRLSGEELFGFANYYVGVVADSLFTADPKAYLQSLHDEYYLEAGDYGMMYNRWDIEFKPYEEGVYETDVIETSVAEIYNWLTYNELPYGEPNVVWVAPADENGIVMLDEVEYISYTHFKVDVQVDSLTHKSGVAKLDIAGADKFYVQLIDASFEQYGADLKTYMNEGGLWMYLQQPEYLQYYEGPVYGDGTYSINLTQFNEGKPLNFNTKYYLVVFPYVEGTAYTDFDTQFMPYVYTANTLPLKPNGTAAATITDKVLSYTSVEATINVGKDIDMVYYSFYDAESYAALEESGSAAIVEALFEDCYSPLTETQAVDKSYLDAGTTMILATLAVGSDGLYGEVVTESLSTRSVPTEVNAEHTVTFGEPVADYSSVSVNIAPAAGVTAFYNFMTETAIANYATEAELVTYLLSRDSASEATDAKKTYMSAGDSITLVVVAVGEDNKYNLYKKVYTTKDYPYSEAMTVSLESVTKAADSNDYTATFAIAGAQKLAFWSYYSGYESSFVSNVVNYASSGNYSTMQFLDVVDGKVTVKFTAQSFQYVYALPYALDSEGVLSAIGKTSYVCSVGSLPLAE